IRCRRRHSGRSGFDPTDWMRRGRIFRCPGRRRRRRLLLEQRIDAEISRQVCRHPRTEWVGDRDALGGEALIRKIPKMPPAAKLEFSVETGIALLAVPDVLDLADPQRRVVDAEIDAVIVAQLRVFRAGPGGVAIRDRRPGLLPGIHVLKRSKTWMAGQARPCRQERFKTLPDRGPRFSRDSRRS